MGVMVSAPTVPRRAAITAASRRLAGTGGRSDALYTRRMRRRGSGGSNYGEFEATALFCEHCRQAQPVRAHLLLVLPSGRKYDYRCTVCGHTVGSKTDDDTSAFAMPRL